MEKVHIGIIGGSALYDMADVTDREDVTLTTPFGEPSGSYLVGTLRGQRVAFLARHGAGHRMLPSEINFRANIFGMKLLGVEYILSASAVGSLREEYRPLDIVIPDQFFDRTKGRPSTFFGRGIGGTRRIRASVLPHTQWACRRERDDKPEQPCMKAVRTSAWRARSSRRLLSPSSIGRGAWTSSA